MKTRRLFLKTTLTASAALCLSRYAGLAAAAATPDSRIDLLLNEKQGAISPNIYGHFTEHLGGVIYDGLWVGLDSKVPNIGGIRRDLVDHMKKINAPLVRYPGGCFADSYDWSDGVGPASKRLRRNDASSHAEPPGPSQATAPSTSRRARYQGNSRSVKVIQTDLAKTSAYGSSCMIRGSYECERFPGCAK